MFEAVEEAREIVSFRKAESDFEKDFYVKVSSRESPVPVECKNVQVLKITSAAEIRECLDFLIEKNYMAAPAEPLADQGRPGSLAGGPSVGAVAPVA